ncbi:coilin [Plectropomus leopardus]|uniref:coilin n=1 Tax=Plectropomus leopardus TaxID=160734 RepID=UPI001C4B6DEC|nr:coilin [Plectropomus leopardus]
MAAHGNNFIRVRLHFDYPPPAVVDCRMCWMLVDVSKCRVVADLESSIREKFEFSRRSILSLFIEDCYLPHTESIYVVRDNDSVRVKVGCLAQLNGDSSCPGLAKENRRKRQRPTEEDGPGENEVNVEWKKKKRKKRSKESLERNTTQASGHEKKKKSKERMTRKMAQENGPTVTPKAVASPNLTSPGVTQALNTTKKPPVAQAKAQTVSSSDSSSSSSDEDEATQKTSAQKPEPKMPSLTPAAFKAPPTTKPVQAKSKPPPSLSSESTSSSDEATTVKSQPKNKLLTSTTPKGETSDNSRSPQALPALQPTEHAQKHDVSIAMPPQDKTTVPCNSDSEEEIELVIRQPMQQLAHGVGGQVSWRNRHLGQTRHGGSGGRGRGGGGGSIGHNEAKEPSCLIDSLSNMSVLLQNGAEGAPEKDYSSMPLLAAPPQVGQKIAFKLLELTENYTPEVSGYKEAKIVSFDPTTKQIELELLNISHAPVEPGKFDLVYQNPDGSESVEYAVSRGSQVTERWDSLLEPRLII